MTLDQLIDIHDVMIEDANAHFPKPLDKALLTSIKPQLKLVETPELNFYGAEEYLEERLEHFFEHMIAVSETLE